MAINEMNEQVVSKPKPLDDLQRQRLLARKTALKTGVPEIIVSSEDYKRKKIQEMKKAKYVSRMKQKESERINEFMDGVNAVGTYVKELGNDDTGKRILDGFLNENKQLTMQSVANGWFVNMPSEMIKSQVKRPLDLLKTSGEVLEGVSKTAERTVFSPIIEGLLGSSALDVMKSVKQAAVGQKKYEMGDVVRISGVGGKFNEALASTTGFVGMAAITDLVTGGIIRNAAKGGSQFIDDVMSGRFANKMGKVSKKNLAPVKMFHESIKDSFRGLGAEMDDLVSKIDDTFELAPTDYQEVQDILVRAPERVIRRINRLREQQGLGEIVDPKTRVLVDKSIRAMKQARTELGRGIPDNVWSGKMLADETTATLMDDYFSMTKNITNSIKDEALKGQYLELNGQFANLYKLRKNILPTLIDAQGNYKTAVWNLFDTDDFGVMKNAGKYESFMKYVTEYFNEGQNVLLHVNNVRLMNKVKAAGLSNLVKVGVTAAGVGVGASVGLRSGLKDLLGDSDSGSSGGGE